MVVSGVVIRHGDAGGASSGVCRSVHDSVPDSGSDSLVSPELES